MASASGQSKYDTKINPYNASSMSWLMGPTEKSPSELRDEQYAGYVLSLSKVIDDYKNQVLPKKEALALADRYMEKIQELGRVDAERARSRLEELGVGDQRRLALQADFQELKKACGQKVPQFDGKKDKKKAAVLLLAAPAAAPPMTHDKRRVVAVQV
eukprot:CAMPEP_0179196840 /NCGR_PEP_ID=MMETSP0796-20121207/97884_1 /TAXON_ID=73915 /ORGANISM="Pyrodinium bahamense, Strain pbaha01" /LENGTH=157 /DNA_ID=CAMNT_0020901257 /DNA_START=18 /DNA_END=490 /DNA_ORIENTATION=-